MWFSRRKTQWFPPRSSVNKVLLHLVTSSHFRSWNIVQLNSSFVESEFAFSMPALGDRKPSQRYCVSLCVCVCVYGKLLGTSDNVQWQQLMVSLLALWQTVLSVKASWLKLNLSLARPVNNRQRGDTMQFYLTNKHWRNTLAAWRRPPPLSTVGCPRQNSEPAARLALRSARATGTVATSLLGVATKQLQEI